MASHLTFLTPLSLLFLLTTTTAAISPSPFPTLTPVQLSPVPLSPLPPPSNRTQEAQFNSIIDALLTAGDFQTWATFLPSTLDPTMVPLTATFFVPDDDAILTSLTRKAPATPLNLIDPSIFPYHIIPGKFNSSALHLIPTGTRFSTLLPRHSIMITCSSASNFTINDAPLTRPDLYQNAAVSVHGISGVLDYGLYGEDPLPPSPVSPSLSPEVGVEDYDEDGAPADNSLGVMKSKAPLRKFGSRVGLSAGLVALFWWQCAVADFKIDEV